MSIQLDTPQQLVSLLNDNKDKLVILDFYTEWCGPCRKLAPRLETLAQTNNNVIVVKANAENDSLETLVVKYKVRGFPTLIFFKDMKIVDNFAGANEDRIMEVVKKYSAL